MSGSGGGVRRYGRPLVAALAVLAVGLYVWGRDNTPAAFTDRTALPGCGTVEQAAIGATPVTAAEQCLVAAMRAGGGAELVVVGMTDEGARVVTYLRAVPGKPGLEVFDDRTRDRFSTEEWGYRTCPAATGPAALGDCGGG
ncbi:hypothetical protein [Actinoplanes xinjiangensis]|uniref:hypothetical protein n=1 Tax=Actinoplanes xinjiangensis TaxID=512350 RepID=UPI0034277538